MARYTGPKVRISRKFNEPVMGESKVLAKKNYAPGQHGKTKKRKLSEYATQLAEKQKAKYIYGVLERQFENTFDKATRKKGVTGEVLLQLLEARLDNTVYRLGIAPTRRAARQLVVHKHILVGVKKYNWLEWDGKEFEGKLINLPPREDIPENINEQLIVELYSK